MTGAQDPRDSFGEPLGYSHQRFVEPPEFQLVVDLVAKGEPVVLVLGGPGTGKTTLLAALADKLGKAAVGPISARSGPQSLKDALEAQRASRVLLVDGLDELPLTGRDNQAITRQLLQPRRGQQLVASSRVQVAGADGAPSVVLGGQSQAAISEFLSRYLESAPHEHVQRVIREAFQQRGQGEELPTWRELLTVLNDRLPGEEIPTGPAPSELFRVDQTSVLGPDGVPLREEDSRYRAHVARLIEVSDDVLRWLAQDPRRAHNLDSREFERVVAELLSRQGYAVELTPATRDGGFDIRAAHDTALGSFLYLVECKKYAEGRPVGVQVVRSLAGVVHAAGATAGILVTTSSFTGPAQEFRRTIEHQMSLREFEQLAGWLRPAT